MSNDFRDRLVADAVLLCSHIHDSLVPVIFCTNVQLTCRICCRDIAHRYWRTVLQDGDTVVDATCGNGNDTLEIAQQLSVSLRTTSMPTRRQTLQDKEHMS